MTPDRGSCCGVMSRRDPRVHIKEPSFMANVWALSALWVGLALIATLLAIWFRVATALSEIIVGTVAQLIIGAFIWDPGGLAAPAHSGSPSWREPAPSFSHFLPAPSSSRRSSKPNGSEATVGRPGRILSAHSWAAPLVGALHSASGASARAGSAAWRSPPPPSPWFMP